MTIWARPKNRNAPGWAGKMIMTANESADGLAPGLTGRADTVVTPDKTAPVIGSGSANVYASPAVVALMEAAAVACAEAHLRPGQTSLGIHVALHHTAATPPGMKVWAEARLVSVDGRKLTFEIEAHDERERIATATHVRIVVDKARFEAKLAAKFEHGT